MSTRGSRRIAVLGFVVALAGSAVGPLIAEPPPTVEDWIDDSRRARLAMDFTAAVEALDRAAELAAGSPEASASVLIERAIVLGSSGAMDRALAVIDQAVDRLERTEVETVVLARAYRRQAEVRNALGDHAGADRALDRADAIVRRLGSPSQRATLDAARSTLAVHRGDWQVALRYGRRAVRRLDAIGDGDAAISPLSNIAYALHQLGRWSEAEASYQQVIDRALEVGDLNTLEFAYCNRAEIHRQRGDLEAAITDLEHAMRGFERARAGILGTADERARYLARQVAAYERLILARVDAGQPRHAFDVAERFHGRSFLELLDPATRLAAVRRLPQLQDLQRPILSRMAEIHVQLSRDSATRVDAMRAELGRLEARLAQIAAGGLDRDRPEAAWVAPEPPTVDAVQAALRDDEVLLVYWLADERLLIWAVAADWIEQVQVPVTRARVEETIAAYLRPLRSTAVARDRALSRSEGEHLELGQQLYRWLIEPLPAAAREAERWIVVPDGHLHHVPLGALVATCSAPSSNDVTWHAAYAGCSFVGLDHAISYVPSAGVLIALRERRRQRAVAGTGSLLAFAPTFDSGAVASGQRALGPLHHNDDEVRRIGPWFEQPRLLVGDVASESQLKRHARSYRHLHLATHGLVDDQFPLGSGVLLAEDRENDGLLQVAEVLDLDLQAELVTLSACRSGRGRLGRGEGIVGLGQAFLYAGASSLVLSLWDVDDSSTPRLMEAFYRHLTAGQSPAEALRDARRELFTQTEERTMVFRRRPMSLAHPRFWSAFVVTGDG